MFIFSLYNELTRALSRAITGRLFTDEEINAITSNAVLKYFKDYFPTPKDEREARDKVNTAQEHILAASSIILEMQTSLQSQNQNLERLLADIEEKKKLAEHYETLAKTNQQEFAAFKAEMEESVRKELQEQAAKNRRLRQVVSLLLWVATLVVGATLGEYFKDIIGWLNG